MLRKKGGSRPGSKRACSLAVQSHMAVRGKLAVANRATPGPALLDLMVSTAADSPENHRRVLKCEMASICEKMSLANADAYGHYRKLATCVMEPAEKQNFIVDEFE
jgi:hypothetical protein